MCKGLFLFFEWIELSSEAFSFSLIVFKLFIPFSSLFFLSQLSEIVGIDCKSKSFWERNSPVFPFVVIPFVSLNILITLVINILICCILNNDFFIIVWKIWG